MPPPGVPYMLLRELMNQNITVETRTGDNFTGSLISVEEFLSVSLSKVNVTFVSGKKSNMENVYIKGKDIRLISLPNSAKEHMHFLKGGPSRSPAFRK